MLKNVLLFNTDNISKALESLKHSLINIYIRLNDYIIYYLINISLIEIWYKYIFIYIHIYKMDLITI